MDISNFIKVFVCLSLAYGLTVLMPRSAAAKTARSSAVENRINVAEVDYREVEDPSNQSQNPDIVAGGQKLTGPNSSAQRRGGRLFLPVLGIARALGDGVGIYVQTRTIVVRRQNGITAEFDQKSGQIRENGSVILMVSNTVEIVFPPNAEELLLPVEIVAALLDASVRFDDAANVVIITRGQPKAETVRTGAEHSFGEIYQVDYDYNLNRYSSFSSQNLNLNATGRIADGRFSFVTGLSGISMSRLQPRNATFTYERAGGQRYVAGDFGTGTDLQFLSSNLRGASVQMNIGDKRITAFGGRTNSGVLLPINELPEQGEVSQPGNFQNRFRYDTTILGVYLTTNSSANVSYRPRPTTISAGLLRFSGRNRTGDMLSGGVKYDDRRLRFQADAGLGKFSGMTRDGSRIKGFGSAFDLSGSLQLRDNLSVQGRYSYIAENFLSPQSGSREPINLKAAGITWSPKKWLSTSLNASTAARPGDNSERNRFVTATINITPQASLPAFFISHTVSNTKQLRNASFTLLNASKDFSRWRLFVNATRIKTFGPASMNAQFGSSFRLNESNAIEVSQGVGSHGALNGQVDWRTSNLLNERLSLSAGMGYTTNNQASVSTFERLTASLRLPRQTSLQISYTQTNAGPTLMLSLRGSLFRKREAQALGDALPSETNSFGKVAGRVYQDVNLNGKYDAGLDQPQANVQVRVDGNRYVVSDANGTYKIDSVKAGQHQVYLDLLSVRADLTLLDGAAQNMTLLRGRDSIVDFRLVRTGRISGVVWLDLNENGRLDENERPLADVRVVLASGRDTLTDSDGHFEIGDLPPGEHVVLIDEKTLPEKTRSSFATLSVKVFAGRDTGEINFAVTAIPAEIKRFGSNPGIRNL